MLHLLVVILTCALTVLGQLLMRQGVWRVGAQQPRATQLGRALGQWRVQLGLALSAAGLLLWLLLVSPWELDYAFPLMSLTSLLIVLLAWWFLGETLTLGKGFGTAFTILGMWLVGSLQPDGSRFLGGAGAFEIMLAVVLLVAAGLSWLAVISRWQISYVYPLLSLLYVVMLPVSWIAHGSAPSLVKVVGALIILLGIVTVIRGGQA